MVLLYISILELLTNPNAEVVPPCSSGRSVQAKNRNRIGDSAEPWAGSYIVEFNMPTYLGLYPSFLVALFT